MSQACAVMYNKLQRITIVFDGQKLH